MQSKLELLNNVSDSGVIAVIRKIPEEKAIEIAESLIEGGVTALEITVESDNAFDVIKLLSAELRDRAIIGAGTVLDATSAELAIKSGADFIVSPILKKEVIETTLRYGKVSIPGAMTLTEMVKAIEYGADIVKMFPASSGGPAFIKNVKGPLPYIPIIPTGGVNAENAADFIKAGAIAVGVGGNLLDEQAIEESNYKKLTELAKSYTEIVKAAKKEK